MSHSIDQSGISNEEDNNIKLRKLHKILVKKDVDKKSNWTNFNRLVFSIFLLNLWLKLKFILNIMKKKYVENNGGNHITNYMIPKDVENKKEKQKSNIKTKK